MSELTGVTAVITVVTETDSLNQTVDTIMGRSSGDIGQILLVVCDKTTPESLAVCRAIQTRLGGLVTIYRQKQPHLGNAIREAFELADQSHVVMMSSDLETDPHTFPTLVEEAKKNPEATITASRWVERGSFSHYGAFRVFLNFAFQAFTRLIYRTSLSDLTFGYRLFPTALVRAIRWEYERHNFLLETILKPIRLGVSVVEVSTTWVPRPEGESQNDLGRQLGYLRPLIRCRFISRKRILHPGVLEGQRAVGSTP